MGMIIAACTGWTKLAEGWPTAEMTIREAIPVAFFSGLGVAVSVLDEQMSSLVGVAISASLLPPAIDAGILWIAYAFTEHGVIPPAATLPASVHGTETRDEDKEYSRNEYRDMVRMYRHDVDCSLASWVGISPCLWCCQYRGLLRLVSLSRIYFSFGSQACSCFA